jgi:hypothetical protein
MYHDARFHERQMLSQLTDVLLFSVWKVMRPVRGFECSTVTGFV